MSFNTLASFDLPDEWFKLAKCNFTASGELVKTATEKQMPCPFLKLFIGDRVCILEERGQWCFGYISSSPSELGLFPSDCLCPVDDQLPSTSGISEGSALVQEINTTLLKWWARIKDLYSRHSELHWQDEVLTYIDELLQTRKKILSGGVPAEELNSIRVSTANSIDRGNLLLSLNVVIRKENGVAFSPDDISIIQTYNAHLDAQKRISHDPKEKEHAYPTDPWSLLFEVQSTTVKQKYDCEFVCSIYDVENRQFVSEPFRFVWSAQSQSLSGGTVKGLFVDMKRCMLERKMVLISRVARIAPIEATSSTLKKQMDVGPKSQFCRQLFAFDILALSTFFSSTLSNSEPVTKVIHFNREDTFAEAFGRLLKGSPACPKHDDDCRMVISMQLLPGPTESLRTLHPHVFARVPPAIIHRTELVNPADEVHNELFVTLISGDITGKSSDRNVECRISVLTSSGNRLPDSFEARGSHKMSTYHAYLVMHEEKPKWHEIFKVLLPQDTEQDIHLRFSFYVRRPFDKNKPEKGPFAIAYAKVIDSAALIEDGQHELLVYKVESAHVDETNTSYLSLPENRKVLKEIGTGKPPQTMQFSLSEKSGLLIQTKSCSSILTDNQHLLDIFRWKQNTAKLGAALNAINHPKDSMGMEPELVKNITTFLDTIFEIWDEREALELSLFDALVKVLKMSDEPQHVHVAPTLAAYIERFPYTTACTRLIHCLNHYLTSRVDDPNKSDRPINTMKVLSKLAQLIVNSKQSADRIGVVIPHFDGLMHTLLDSFVSLMAEDRKRMAVQNTALRNLPSMITPFLTVLDSQVITKTLVRMMKNFGKSIIARERLGFVGQLIDGELFEYSTCRTDLLPHCIELLLLHLETDPLDETEEYASNSIHCGKILCALIEKLWPANHHRDGTEEELSYLFVHCYRPIVRTMVFLTKFERDDGRALFFTLILSFLHKVSAQIFGQYLETRERNLDRLDFLLEVVQMLRDVLTRSPFLSTWSNMIIMQNKIVHKTLRFVVSAIQQFFGTGGYVETTDLWQEYMLTLVCFVSQPSLQSDDEMAPSEGDTRRHLRRAAAKDLRSLWFRLTPSDKMLYIPRLVGAFLKVALLDDVEIREAIIPIFFDMMQSDFHQHNHSNQPITPCHKLPFYEEMIAQLDYLVDQDRGTKSFQKDFTRIITAQKDSDVEMWNHGGKEFIARVDRLLGHLFEYRHVRESCDNQENGMSRTVQLLKFYEQHGHYELQITYVYKLYALHIRYANLIEAAFTLLMHADKLTWKERELPEVLVRMSLNRHCATEIQLKDQLLNEVADLFAEGEMWENAIQILRQLEPIYVTIYYDYEKVSNLLNRMADLYRKIDRGERLLFLYYVVGFYGRSFPSYLNGKQFVFRSDKLERLDNFVQRMQQTFGGPQIIAKMDDCSHLVNSPGKYIQVFSVDAVGSARDTFPKQVNPSIKHYYRYYNVNKFEFSRMQDVQDSKWTQVENTELMRMWIAKRVIVTAETLPNILRFTQVVSISEPHMISPLERAVDEMQKKNEELLETALLVPKESYKNQIRNFSGHIIGVLRAAVQGGIQNYEVFQSEKFFDIYTKEEKALAMELHALIVDQVRILEYCIFVHGQAMEDSEDARKIHAALTDAFGEHKRYVEEKFSKTSSMLPHGASIYQFAASTPAANPPLSEKKNSALSMGSVFNGDISNSSETLKKKMFGLLPRRSTGNVDALSSVTATISETLSRVPSDRLDPMRIFEKADRMRADGVDNLKRLVRSSPLHRKYTTSTSSMQGGVKMRVSNHQQRHFPAGPAPPVPARIITEPPVPPGRPNRRLLPDRKDKPLPPTPL